MGRIYVLLTFMFVVTDIIAIEDMETNLKLNKQSGLKSRANAASLIGHPNDAHFGKDFYFQVDTFQHIVYGHENEVYNFTFWFGPVRCGDGFTEICDDRTCGIPKGKAYCDNTTKDAYCKCKYDQVANYAVNCDAPKLVLDTKNYYYGKNETPQTETYVRTQNFMATCNFTDDQKTVPIEPEPVISITEPLLSGEEAGLEVQIVVTQYIAVPGVPVYFWMINAISINVNQKSLTAFLETKQVQKIMANIFDKKLLRTIESLQNSN